MSKYVVDADHVTIRFNLSSEKINNLKEYAIKLVKHQLMFQEFLALDDVSLKVKKGEAWGLIGTNGSGKSTFLKAIAGILKPYKGTIKVKGRIAPLIELGAGFDGELTARENIYMNGTLLGHSREFMDEHFDEIVEFANIKKFLDSPVKNFSSGMKARLGFAVATVDCPDVLIVDEALEVGDMNFRKKCRERMAELLEGGTTLLFVSHNIRTVREVCDHAIWLDKGITRMSGDVTEVCDAYQEEQDRLDRERKEKKRTKKFEKNGKIYDYLVVGSGLYGAVFAREMENAGKRCLVLEKRDHIGGNIYTEEVDGIHVHKYGAHIFHTSNEEVWKYINKYAEFNNYINSPVAVYGDELYNLPFNMNTFSKLWGIRTPAEAKAKIAEQIADLQITDPQNLEEQALSLVGRDVYEKLIKGYTEKQWGRDCKDLPAFIIKRLPLRFTYNNNYFNDVYQGIPKGGYTQIIEKLLENVDVMTETDFFEYRREHDNFKKIVFTGMIDEYFDYRLGHLEYRTVRFETERVEDASYQGNAVVNYTAKEVPYTRIIEHKHFEPELEAEEPKNYTIISREYSTEWKPGIEPYYPVNDEKNSKLYEAYRELAEKEENVIFGGRLGQYKYYDMDKVIDAALAAARKELGK